MRAKDALGRYGEDLAARHLTALGLVILARNWRCSIGELDIIARDGPCLVVCEVKTRRSEQYGLPVEAVGPRKLRRLRHAALRWLDEQQVHVPTIRFDVIGIVQPRSGPPVLQHLVGVE
ncbi:MAG: YraN family protein [Actinomycetota bacterium]|nr:YraN family protein [Actinomycetota bacterium]MDP1876680.1 YraN family protein [Actinomycetota bacterium]